MSYGAGMMADRIKVWNRADATTQHGAVKAGGWELALTTWAAVDWTRGVKSMREGALDAYDTIMVRCRWHAELTRQSRVEHDGVMYQIESFHADKREDTIQITAYEVQK